MNLNDDLIGHKIIVLTIFDLELDDKIHCPITLYDHNNDKIILRKVEDIDIWSDFIDKQIESNRSNNQLYSRLKKSKYEIVIETLNGNKRFNEIRMWVHFVLVVVLSWNMILTKGMNIATGPNSSRSVGNILSSRRFQSHRGISAVNKKHLENISKYLEIILKKTKDKLVSIDVIRQILGTIVSNQNVEVAGTSIVFYFTIIDTILGDENHGESTYKASLRFSKMNNNYGLYSKMKKLYQKRGKLIHGADKCFLPEDQAFLEESAFYLIERFIIDEDKFNSIDEWLFF